MVFILILAFPLVITMYQNYKEKMIDISVLSEKFIKVMKEKDETLKNLQMSIYNENKIITQEYNCKSDLFLSGRNY